MNITEFLEARIAEDEETARYAPPAPWVRSVGRVRSGLGTVVSEFAGTGSLDHIARFDPKRVLAECAAKRAIVRRFDVIRRENKRADKDYRRWIKGKPAGPTQPRTVPESEFRGLETAVRHLAAVYDQHPDYDPAWRNA